LAIAQRDPTRAVGQCCADAESRGFIDTSSQGIHNLSLAMAIPYYTKHKPRMKTLQARLWWVWVPLVLTLQIHAQSDEADKSSHVRKFITVNGVRLHYLEWGGAGEGLLFLHGMGDTAHIYDKIAPRFTNQFRVLGLTRRGHGESEIPGTGYGTATLVEDIRQFLDALRIQRVVLAGHSFPETN